ncbi:MAG: hypothetical protein ACOC8D_02600 [bacterium]
MRDWRSAVAAAVVVGMGVVLRVGFVAAADAERLVRLVPDDAFYYVKTAEHLAAGHGPTFDGLHATNGFHPLWMALCVAAAATGVGGRLALAKAVVGLGAALSVATAVVLWGTLRRLSRAWFLPAVGVLLYFLNERAMASSLSGLETSLASLLFVAALWLTVREACGEAGGAGREVALGAVLGLLFLARTDTVFYIAAFWGAAVALAARGRRLRRAATVAATAAVMAAPWLGWSWWRFGTPVQASGLSVPWVAHARYRLAGHSTAETVGHGLRLFAGFVKQGFPGEMGYPLWFTALAGLGALGVLAARWRDPDGCPAAVRRTVAVLGGLAAAALGLIFVHTAVRWYPRPWYFDQVIIVFAVGVALAVGVAEPGQTVKRLVWGAYPKAKVDNPLARGFVVLVCALAVAVPTNRCLRRLARGDWPWAMEMLDAARWLEANTTEDATAAAFNAGIIGYFSDRRVVNLDGAINNAAYAALRRRDLMGLMREAGVEYYLDFEPLMTDQFAPFLSPAREQAELRLVAEVDRPEVDWCDSHIKVYRIQWTDEPE